MTTPNLFQFASSELSQDAFISWLLSWAQPKMEKENASLHETGRDLIRALLEKHDRSAEDPPALSEVHQQHKRADVVAVLEGDMALLIEDKVGASAHSEQLDRYRSALEEEFSEVLPIFFKTGDQSDYQHARENGYEPFLRKDFLTVLRRGDERGVESDIFQDYREHLETIEKKVRSFETVPVGEWPRAAWKGFYQVLQDQLGEGSWSHVPNQSGGFMAFYWHSFSGDGCKQYLVLEEEKPCFKIEVEDENRYKPLRETWHGRVVEASKESPAEARKPDRFGYGEHMTVAVLSGGYLETDEEDLVDIEETLTRLREAEDILSRAVAEN